MRTGPALRASACAIGVAIAAAPALADRGASAGHVSLGVLAGYGFKDSFLFGVGIRGGYTLPMNVYIGGTLMTHFGSEVPTPNGGEFVSANYFGAEAGFDIPVGRVVTRPYIGLGVVAPSGSYDCEAGFGAAQCSGSDLDFKQRLGVWPGVTASYYPVDTFFIGGDARFLIARDFNAPSLSATCGIQF